MIRLRDMIERACRHRLLGPVVVVLLVLLLASVVLHVAIEGAEAAAELGNLCVAIAAALGSLLVPRLSRSIAPRTAQTAPRGPPSVAVVAALGSAGRYSAPVATPLRR